MKRWREGAKVFTVSQGKQIAAVVVSTSIRDKKQYCLLRVAVEHKITGKMIVADQVKMVPSESLTIRATIVKELGEKEEML